MADEKKPRGRPRTKPRPTYDDEEMIEKLVDHLLTGFGKNDKVHSKKISGIHKDGIGKWWRQLSDAKQAEVDAIILTEVRTDIIGLYKKTVAMAKGVKTLLEARNAAVTIGIYVDKMATIADLHSSAVERMAKATPTRSENQIVVKDD